MSFVYTAGLNNMGSYQVSGRPWLKSTASLADGLTEYLTFDNVTKKVRVKNHSTSGKLRVGFADNARRAYDMPDSDGHLEASFISTNTFTVSFWMKPLFTNPATSVSRVLQLGSNANTRLQGTGTGGFRFIVASGVVNSAGNLYESGKWTQVTVVINESTNKLYVNGVLAATNTATAPNFTELSIGADATNFDDIYDEMYLFNTPFTQAEVTELYAAGGYFDPRDHSQAANLVSWWAFEDNGFRTYFTTADTITTINDRIGSNNLTKAGSGTGAFVNGRQLDTAATSHSIIIPAGGEVELNVKSKSMFLKADGATQSFDVYASLTGIPAERMYDLTGPGIDE
tara:strand:- start:6 stop:1031 length:1026 start_codon:yes stop_codon:yes gene_type:complete